MALTRRGWAVASGVVVLGAGGRMLGLVELFVLATACLVLIGVGLVSVRIGEVHLEATRRLDPPRVHAGGDARVELSVTNRGDRRTPVVAVRDALTGGGRRRQARFQVAPLAPGQTDRASYRLTLERRGRYELGPLEVERTDPFGLVSTARTIAPEAELLVYPRVEVVAPIPSGSGSTSSGTHLPSIVSAAGDDFYGLREYQVGDDLRRVHWPSTARSDSLMIRQLELPWQGRATVVLDVREAVHTQESLELAVSAAASLLLASWRHGVQVRMVTTAGADSGFGQGHAHLETVLDHLAILEPLAGTDLAANLGGLRGPEHRSALAVVTTGAASAGDLSLLAAPQRRGDGLAVVFVTSGSGATPGAPALPLALRGAVVTAISPSRPLAAAWGTALAGVSRTAPSTRGARR